MPVNYYVRPQLWISAHFVISAWRRRLASQICKHGIEFGKPHCATYRSTVLIALKNFCVVTFGAGHELTRKYNGVLPNWSLNRTLCGSPILGFKSLAQNRPTAKCRLARTLGLIKMAPARCQSEPFHRHFSVRSLLPCVVDQREYQVSPDHFHGARDANRI